MARKRQRTETTETAVQNDQPQDAAENAAEQPAEESAAPAVEMPEAVVEQPLATETPAEQPAAESADISANGRNVEEPAPESEPGADAESPQPEAGAPAEPALTPEQEHERLKRGIESLLFITDHPLPLAKLAKCAGLTVKEHKKAIQVVEELRAELAERGSALQIIEVADGFQMGTKPVFAPFVKKLFSEKMTMRLSTAAHETLSIIAYKQPLTRAEIEQIRGVEVIAAIETLLEKRLIEVVGRKETVGRPLLYGTTTDFLRHFGLRSLEDLPPIDSFTPENAPLGERVQPEAEAPTPGEAALEEVPSTEAGEHEDMPVEAGGEAKPPAACAEAASKEFAAGEEMAAESEAEAKESFDETGSAPVTEKDGAGDVPDARKDERPRRKSFWD